MTTTTAFYWIFEKSAFARIHCCYKHKIARISCSSASSRNRNYVGSCPDTGSYRRPHLSQPTKRLLLAWAPVARPKRHSAELDEAAFPKVHRKYDVLRVKLLSLCFTCDWVITSGRRWENKEIPSRSQTYAFWLDTLSWILSSGFAAMALRSCEIHKRLVTEIAGCLYSMTRCSKNLFWCSHKLSPNLFKSQ